MARLRQQRLAVEAPARRFLATFFRYEVGQDGPEVRRSMAATSTHGFYESLQRRPPAPVAGGGFPARAVLERLRISFVSRTLGRALVRGTARRNGLPEEFAFIFIRRAYGWVAAAAGE